MAKGSDDTGVITNSIRTNKQVYEFGEQINLYGQLVNNGTVPVRINKRFLIHLDLQPTVIRLDTREKMTWLPPPMPTPLGEGSFFLILPGEKEDYRLGGLERHLTVSQFEGGNPAPGKYSIQVKYVGIAKDPITHKTFEAWTGCVSSNTVEVAIISPGTVK